MFASLLSPPLFPTSLLFSSLLPPRYYHVTHMPVSLALLSLQEQGDLPPAESLQTEGMVLGEGGRVVKISSRPNSARRAPALHPAPCPATAAPFDERVGRPEMAHMDTKLNQILREAGAQPIFRPYEPSPEEGAAEEDPELPPEEEEPRIVTTTQAPSRYALQVGGRARCTVGAARRLPRAAESMPRSVRVSSPGFRG